MNPPLRKIFYWSARTLGIILIILPAQLYLSAVSYEQPFGEVLLVLIPRLWLPAALVLALILAWRREAAGGVLYLVLAGLSAFLLPRADWIINLFLIASVAVTGLLFLFSAWMQGQKQPKE